MGVLSSEENALLHGKFSDITLCKKKRERGKRHFLGNLNNVKEKKTGHKTVIEQQKRHRRLEARKLT